MKNLSAILLGSCLLCAHTAVAQDTTTASGSELKASASVLKDQSASAELQRAIDAGIENARLTHDDPLRGFFPFPADPSNGGPLGRIESGEGGGRFGSFLGGVGKAQLSGPAARMVTCNNMMITWSKDNDQLRGFSLANGKWTLLPIPPQKEIVPILGSNVAAVKLKKGIAAYSADTQRWAILTFPETSKASPSVSDSLVTVYDSNHIYTFAASNGRWTSPTDKTLKETKETIQSDNFIYSQQQLDEAVEGLSVFVSNSRGPLTARGAKRDVDELKKRLAQLKLSQQSASPFPNRLLPKTEPAPIAHTPSARVPSARAPQPVNSNTSRPFNRLPSFGTAPILAVSEAASLSFAKLLRLKQDKHPLTKTDKSELQKLVSAALEERLKAQQKSVDDLRKKLKAVEQKLKVKTDNKEKMIERRVDELLNPELDWNSVSNKASRQAIDLSFFEGTSSKESTQPPHQ